MSNIFKIFSQSLQSLRANPVRTILTTLGIVIGIATVVMVLSAGAGFRSLVNDQIQSLGNDTLFVKTRVPPTTKNRASTFAPGIAVGITSFKQSDLDDIKKLNNVINDYGMVTGLAVASYRNNEKNIIYYGSSAERFNIDQHQLKEGRFYSENEDAGATQVVILGSNLAKDLFLQDDPMGKLIRLGNLNFQVIGVYEPQGPAGGADDSLFIPLRTAQKKMIGVDYISVGVVQMQDIRLSEATAKSIKSLLRHNHNITGEGKDDFIVMTQAQVLDIYNVIFSGITILLITIAAISLVVGGVGIMNIMYVTFTERIGEIGLKKALGARNSDILNEFLIESILITLLGGVIGILAGSVLGWLVSAIATYFGLVWKFIVPFYAIIISLGISGTIGILFSVLPAKSASKLDPVESLRYE